MDNILERLEKQTNIKLNSEEKILFLQDFADIMNLLDTIQNFPDDIEAKNLQETRLRVITKQQNFLNPEKILSNSQHPLLNNSIVIKSVI